MSQKQEVVKQNKHEITKRDFTPIVVKKGYYNGLIPYKDAVEAQQKSQEELEKKDTAVLWTAFLVISLLLAAFFPLINNYVKEVEQSMYEGIELMPEVAGMNEAEAKLLLSDYEVVVERVERVSDYFEDGVVTKSNVNPGTVLSPEQVIKLYVCSKPENKATKLETIVMPKFPVSKNQITFKSAELKDGVLYIVARNDGDMFKSFSVTLGQYNNLGEKINARRFFIRDVEVQPDEVFEFKVRLTNPQTYKFEIESAQRYAS